MKYLLISTSILAALCLGLLIAPLLTPRPEAVEGSLIVNQRTYQPRELEERLRTTPYHFDSKSELIDDLINRELLLQEAKKQKIDAEIAFRRSMRDFYEQSMIKTLLDRQYGSAENQPSSTQVATCRSLLSTEFQLRRFDYPTLSAVQNNTGARVEEYNLPYLELPEDTRAAVPDLKEDKLSAPLHSTAGWFRLQLVATRPLAEIEQPSQVEQEKLCRSELRKQKIQGWIEQLHQKAAIRRPTAVKGGE